MLHHPPRSQGKASLSPAPSTASSTPLSLNLHCSSCPQPKELNTQPYLVAKKDSNGAPYCKEDTVVEDKEAESDRAQTEDEDGETTTVRPSYKLAAHVDQETAL